MTTEKVAETAEVIHACHMVGMTVRKDEQVDPIDPIPEALQAKFRSCVDLDVKSIHDDVDGSASAMVARIRGEAHRAVAGDHRDPLRGARAQKNDVHGPTETGNLRDGKGKKN
jgi:hypothetical protein